MKRFLSLTVLLAVSFASTRARAGGFFLADRGVRSMGRGGAMVAGVDDPSALYINPAGLAFSGRQFLADATLPMLRASYTRVDGGGNVLPTVHPSQVPLVVPTVAYSDSFGLDKVTFGLGVWAPNSAIVHYPTMVNGEPAPQRYSLMDMRGTLLTTVAGGLSFRPIEQLSLGIRVGANVGSFGTTLTMSACDGAICTQPENPDYDSVAQINVPFLAAPSVAVGMIGTFGRLRFGASFDLPYTLHGSGDLRVRLPSAAIYETAYVDGNGSVDSSGHHRATGSLNVPFPWIARLGIEVRPVDAFRLEAAFVVEGWKRENAITLTPNDVYIRNVQAVDDYQLGPVAIPRHMRNTMSARLGGELTTGIVTLRAGVQYETSAFRNPYLSALTLDSNKIILGGGGSLEVVRGLSFDAMFAYSIMQDVNVTNSLVPQPNPIRPAQQSPDYIGNGVYSMDAWFVGVGLRYRVPVRAVASTAPAAPPQQQP